MLKLFREEGELPFSLLCGYLFSAIAIAKLILIWNKLIEWSNLKLWRVVAYQSKKKLPLDYHRISCYHVILYQKCWNSEPGHLFNHEKAVGGEGVPENFIDISQVFWTIWRLSLPIRTILIKFLDILTFSYCKQTNDISI